MILFINACVRKESRTKRLADALLAKLDGDVTEVKFEDIDFQVTGFDVYGADIEAILAKACAEL